MVLELSNPALHRNRSYCAVRHWFDFFWATISASNRDTPCALFRLHSKCTSNRLSFVWASGPAASSLPCSRPCNHGAELISSRCVFTPLRTLTAQSSLIALLKKCTKEKDVCTGARIHADIFNNWSPERQLHLGNALVNMYAKCGVFGKAQEVFEELPVRNVVSWTAFISGYVQNGYGLAAIKWFETMQFEGISPNPATYVCILKACGSIGALQKGQEIHAEVIREGYLEINILVATAVVDMYSQCGTVAHAQEVFDGLSVRNVVTWNVLIQAYVEHNHAIKALQSYEQMQYEGLSPDDVTFLCILKACATIGEIEKGQKVHAEAFSKGFVNSNVYIVTTLVDMYAKCGEITKAKAVFDGAPIHNLVSWTILIAAYAEHAHGEEAFICYKQMQLEGYFPDSVCFGCILKVCASMKLIGEGQTIHAAIIADHWLEKDVSISTPLVDMYAKCGAFTKARRVLFDDLSIQHVATWTALLAGFSDYGNFEESLRCFQQMQQEGVFPDETTFICMIKACAHMDAISNGQRIHATIIGQVSLNNDFLVGITLLDMYASFSMLKNAEDVFDQLLVQNQLAWSALLRAYVQCGCDEETIGYFKHMQNEGLTTDMDTLICILKACGSLGAFESGQRLHVKVVREGLEKDIWIGTAVLDMYAKCGSLIQAQEVFNELAVRDVVCWNALMAGYAQLGKDDIVFSLFDKMMREDVRPNPVSFIVLLNSCNHCGLLHQGHACFETMKSYFDIVPNIEHYTCLVDLFGRAGHFDKAIVLMRDSPLGNDILLWHTILAACQKWGNIELGILAFEHAVKLDEHDAAIYVLVSNIYAIAGMQ